MAMVIRVLKYIYQMQKRKDRLQSIFGHVINTGVIKKGAQN